MLLDITQYFWQCLERFSNELVRLCYFIFEKPIYISMIAILIFSAGNLTDPTLKLLTLDPATPGVLRGAFDEDILNDTTINATMGISFPYIYGMDPVSKNISSQIFV